MFKGSGEMGRPKQGSEKTEGVRQRNEPTGRHEDADGLGGGWGYGRPGRADQPRACEQVIQLLLGRERGEQPHRATPRLNTTGRLHLTPAQCSVTGPSDTTQEHTQVMVNAGTCTRRSTLVGLGKRPSGHRGRMPGIVRALDIYSAFVTSQGLGDNILGVLILSCIHR